VKANFCIQKNTEILIKSVEEIDKMKNKIIEQYGQFDEKEKGYTIPPDKIELTNQELNDLFAIE
jgi:hypothetical protein